MTGPCRGVAGDDLDPERQGAGADDGDGLGVAGVVDEEALGLCLGHAFGHGHRLGGGGRLVQKRGVGDGEAREVGDHRLVVQERLEPALGDFGLVGGIGGVPGGVFEDVALDRGGVTVP